MVGFEKPRVGLLSGASACRSLATYRELCALATDMGQPDLLYRFMDLANHAAAATSSRGAAFGCARMQRREWNKALLNECRVWSDVQIRPASPSRLLAEHTC